MKVALLAFIAYSLIIAINRSSRYGNYKLECDRGDAATVVLIAKLEGSLNKEIYYS